MEGPIALVSCASVNFYAPCGDCQDEATCAIRRAFTILRDQSTAVLDSISLAQGAGWEERLGDRANKGELDGRTLRAAADGALVHGRRRSLRCLFMLLGCVGYVMHVYDRPGDAAARSARDVRGGAEWMTGALGRWLGLSARSVRCMLLLGEGARSRCLLVSLIAMLVWFAGLFVTPRLRDLLSTSRSPS